MQVLHENAPTSVGALEDSDFDRFHVSLEDVRLLLPMPDVLPWCVFVDDVLW